MLSFFIPHSSFLKTVITLIKIYQLKNLFLYFIKCRFRIYNLLMIIYY